MIKAYCDRCNDELKHRPDPTKTYVQGKFSVYVSVGTDKSPKRDDIPIAPDLCKDCITEIILGIHNVISVESAKD